MDKFFKLCVAFLLGLLMTKSAIANSAVEAGEVSISLDQQGRVVSFSIAGRNLSAGLPPAPLVSLCDVTRGDTFVPGIPEAGSLTGGLRLSFAGVEAEAVLRGVPHENALHFTCRVEGKRDLPDRGVLLRFAFPANCIGWRWHDDTQTSRPITPDGLYENVTPLRAWADLPEWKDKPDLKMGYANRNFCTVLTGEAGLCLSVPLDAPCIFRTAYNARERQLQLLYDFALSPETREPNTWSFAFDLYACNPEWGFRSALAEYYKLYPEMFTNYVKRPGQWMAFNRLSQIDNANEFRFGLQEGAPEPEYDDKIGVLSTTYFTHAGMFANIPNYDPEKDPLPPHEVLVKAMADQFKRTTGLEGIFEAVGLHDSEGKLDVQKTSVYGHIISQFNLDPELPYGAWHLNRTGEQTKYFKEKRGGELDGFYYDGLTAGLNYRRDHFKYSEAPPLWDPVARKAFLNNFFSSCSFARAAAEQLRPRGQITMMNGALGASFFVAPWLDVFGSETGLRISRSDLNYIRSIAYHKPFLTLLKGNYEKAIGHAEIELFMKRALAYGIFPGFFDWPPSGLGPGGRYWDHPEYYERDRDLFRKYLPLCQALSKAGWEPVTYARSSVEKVYVERFGPGEDGVIFLTLLNEDNQTHETTLTIDLKQLGLSPGKTKCVEMLSGNMVPLTESAGQAVTLLTLPSEGVAMLRLCSPQQAAAQRMEWAEEVVELGRKMREVDRQKPPVAVHWRPLKGWYGREKAGDSNILVFGGERKEEQQCSQWAMLFQPKPAPVTLTVRAAGENIVGSGSPQIQCRAAWVSPSFTHDELLRFELPKGTYDWREFTFTIPTTQALRAIEVIPTFPGSLSGKLKLASIRLADTFGDDYIVDADFHEWYEPVPQTMRERLDTEYSALQVDLRHARETLLKNLTGEETRKILLSIGARCSRLRRWIKDEKAENGCRRVLRDIETVETHLGEALLLSLGLTMPRIKGAGVGAPGDDVLLSFAAPATSRVPIAARLISGDGMPLRSTAQGYILPIPHSAPPGSKLHVTGELVIGSKDMITVLRTSHSIEVVAPLALKLENMGTEAETGVVRLKAVVSNCRNRATTVRLAIQSPEGWQAPAPQDLPLKPGEQKGVELKVQPQQARPAGMMEFTASARAGADSANTSCRILHIPPQANLLKNGGFEKGSDGWSLPAEGAVVDTRVAYSGTASIRLRNTSREQRNQVSQSVTLNQQRPCPILVRAVSRGEEVTGGKDSGYSLYVDIYYTDGTPLYGRTYNFETGTSDWQLGELYIEPAKPIRNVNIYLLLRGKAGTVWFDDIALAEDPRRAGNLAREAQVLVDSCFSQYDPHPLNDGIVYPAPDAHWTDEAWASAETETDHFVELNFAEPKTIQRVVVYWSLDAGIPRTSAEIQVQVREGDGWRTVASAKPDAPIAQTTIDLPAPVSSKAIRLFQPKGRGPVGRPHLMWVREIELFEQK